MFIQEHHVSRLIYYEHVKLLSQHHTRGLNYCATTAKKAYLLRVASTIDAFKGAAIGFIIQATKGINEFVIGVLHWDMISIKNSTHYFAGALIDLCALPVLGTIGVIVPPIALTLTAKVSEFSRDIISSQSEDIYRTTSFNQITARLISPIRGVTDALTEILMAISQIVSKLLIVPIENRIDAVNQIFIPHIKGYPKPHPPEIKSLAEGCEKLLEGAKGVIFSESRKHLDIYP